MDDSSTFDYLPRLLVGALHTLEITGLAFVIAVILGIPVLALLQAPSRTVREVSRFAMMVLRGIPELVALYLMYYGLGSKGINVVPLVAACLGLGIIQSAFVAEIYRASLRTVHSGQREAAASLGLSNWQQWRLVIVPQALRFSLPPLVNVFLALLKLSVVASAIGAGELLFEAQNVMNVNFDIAPVALLTLAIFLVITFPITWGSRLLERRFREGQVDG